MIRLALSIDPEARALRKRVDDEIDSVIAENRERVARARFAVYGTSVYPDATFSPRLSYGAVSGWTDGGTKVVPFTRIGGLYLRATGREPYALPDSWTKAEGKVDGSVPFDFVTTNDIVGGSSGSPVVDRNRRLVGLAFDGNLESIANDYFFDAEKSRMVAVDSRAILEALEKVYGAAWLAKEIGEAAGN